MLPLRRVCACMQTQVKVQMDERDGQGHPPPNPLQAPGQQTMGYSAYAGPPQVSRGPVVISWSIMIEMRQDGSGDRHALPSSKYIPRKGCLWLQCMQRIANALRHISANAMMRLLKLGLEVIPSGAS